MSRKLKTVFLGMLALACLSFKAGDPLEKILKQLAKLTASYPQEKVHLHTDKPYYAVGEDIWFKSYVVTAEKNEPSLLSKVLYVDLIDQNNVIRKKLTLPIENGLANGNINLIDSLPSGNYRIRSYTNYMRNFSADFFFEKQLKIGNVLDTVEKAAKTKKSGISLQFFPEGGNLVSGVRSKVGLKALAADGNGINLNGYILNKAKEKVAEFTTEHAGMGVFAFTPLKNEKYTAVANLAEGQTETFELPMAEESGFSLAISQSSDKINFRIAASADMINTGKEVIVVGQSNGIIYASFTGKIEGPIMATDLPKDDFPTGIAQFTLFTADYKPIAERLLFVNHNDQLKIELDHQHAIAATKKKMQYSLQVTDNNNNPVDGSFSVAVTDAGKVKASEDDETSIFSNLLLTSDLKGYIEQPNYYFNAANPNREKDLDNLLLTQGWRRFVWKDVIAEKEPEISYRPEQSLEIAGKVSSWGNKPLANAKVSLFSTTPGLLLKLDTLSDAKGNFFFDRLDVADSTSFLVQTKFGKDNPNMNIKVNQRPAVQPYAFAGQSFSILPYLQSTKTLYTEMERYQKLDKGILLKTVNIVTKPILKSSVKVRNSVNISGSVDYVIDKKTLAKETYILTPFTRVPGIYTQNGMIWRMRRTSITGHGPMLLVVDGVKISQASDPYFITTINPTDLEGIEVLTSDYNLSVFGPDAGNGIIFITTKRGGDLDAVKATNMARISNFGYTKMKEFYVPDYDNPKTDQQMLDLRSTVYWNPNVNTDVKGKASFGFFNTDSPGTYRVTIEGIDSFGKMARKVYTYEVK